MNELTPYFADMHIHSALSPCADNDMLPFIMARMLKELGYKIFSITDHNACENLDAFQAAADEEDLLLIPGVELQSSEEVHVLAYFPSANEMKAFFNDVVDPVRPPFKNNVANFGSQLLVNVEGEVTGEYDPILAMPLTIRLEELVDKIQKYHGLVVPAHIERRFGITYQLGFIPPDLHIDAIEITSVEKAKETKQTHLKGKKTTILSSSDTHYFHTFSSPKMRFWLKDLTVEEVLSCIKGERESYVELLSRYY